MAREECGAEHIALFNTQRNSGDGPGRWRTGVRSMDPHPWTAPGLPHVGYGAAPSPTAAEHTKPPRPSRAHPVGTGCCTDVSTALSVKRNGATPFTSGRNPVVTSCDGPHTLRCSSADATGGGAVLRIHMSRLDLSRVRMATRPDALWETILSFHRLRDRRASTVFEEMAYGIPRAAEWRGAAAGGGRSARGYFPDFLTPSREGAEPFGLERRNGGPARHPRRAGPRGTGGAGRRPDAAADRPAGRSAGRRGGKGGRGAARRAHGGPRRTAHPAHRSAPQLPPGGRRALLAAHPEPASRRTGRCAAGPCWTAARTSCWPPCRRRSGGAHPSWRRTTPSTAICTWTGAGCCSSRPSSVGARPSSTRDPSLPPVLVYPVTNPGAPVFAEPGPGSAGSSGTPARPSSPP